VRSEENHENKKSTSIEQSAQSMENPRQVVMDVTSCLFCYHPSGIVPTCWKFHGARRGQKKDHENTKGKKHEKDS